MSIEIAPSPLTPHPQPTHAPHAESNFLSVHMGHIPQIVEKQRTGWYLLPNPIHAKAQNFINLAVMILLFCLLYLFTTPIQSEFGIPTFGTGKVRLGMLDYPLLVAIVVPLLLAPIVLRVIENFGYLNRQRIFLNNAPDSPIIEVEECKSGELLKGSINIPYKKDSWRNFNISWRVGILSPSRHKTFSFNPSPPGHPRALRGIKFPISYNDHRNCLRVAVRTFSELDHVPTT